MDQSVPSLDFDLPVPMACSAEVIFFCIMSNGAVQGTATWPITTDFENHVQLIDLTLLPGGVWAEVCAMIVIGYVPEIRGSSGEWLPPGCLSVFQI